MFFTLRVFSVTGNHTGPVRIFPTWSSGWNESREGLLVVTDVSTSRAEAIFRVKWRLEIQTNVVKRLSALWLIFSSQLRTYSDLDLQTGSKYNNHHSPSSLPIILLFQSQCKPEHHFHHLNFQPSLDSEAGGEWANGSADSDTFLPGIRYQSIF